MPRIVDDAEVARHGRDFGLCGGLLGFDLVAHRRDRIWIGTDEDDAGLLQRTRKRLALGQEAIAGMHGLGARALAGIHDPVDQQVAFGGRRRTASSAISTWSASRSASEYTATVLIPMLRAVLITRQAISPRFAIRIFLNMCF